MVKDLTPEEIVAQLVPEGETAAALDKTADGVTAIYKSESTFVIVASAEGYGGKPVTAYVAVDGEGRIAGLYVDAAGQTKGLGTKVAKEEYTSQFVGLDSPDGVDAITGATISSNALKTAIKTALAAYETVKGA